MIADRPTHQLLLTGLLGLALTLAACGEDRRRTGGGGGGGAGGGAGAGGAGAGGAGVQGGEGGQESGGGEAGGRGAEEEEGNTPSDDGGQAVGEGEASDDGEADGGSDAVGEGEGAEGEGAEGEGAEGEGVEGEGAEGEGAEGEGAEGEGVDEPCEGQTFVDESGTARTRGDPCRAAGICGTGLVECVAATDRLRCSTAPGGSDDQSEDETCNGEDDDCDGEVDRGAAGNVCAGGGPGDGDARAAMLCDEDWAQAEGVEHEGICGIPDDPMTSYWLDFDSGLKVPPRHADADLAKGSQDCCSWAPENGSLQHRSDTPADQLNEGRFPCDDDMAFVADVLEHNIPHAFVVCLQTTRGNLVAYTTEFDCCGDNIVHWRLATD